MSLQGKHPLFNFLISWKCVYLSKLWNRAMPFKCSCWLRYLWCTSPCSGLRCSAFLASLYFLPLNLPLTKLETADHEWLTALSRDFCDLPYVWFQWRCCFTVKSAVSHDSVGLDKTFLHLKSFLVILCHPEDLNVGLSSVVSCSHQTQADRYKLEICHSSKWECAYIQYIHCSASSV